MTTEKSASKIPFSRGGKSSNATLNATTYQKGRKRPEKARPADAETVARLHGTRGRMFDRQADGRWLDTDTGAVGTLAELERAWLAGLQDAPAGQG